MLGRLFSKYRIVSIRDGEQYVCIYNSELGWKALSNKLNIDMPINRLKTILTDPYPFLKTYTIHDNIENIIDYKYSYILLYCTVNSLDNARRMINNHKMLVSKVKTVIKL